MDANLVTAIQHIHAPDGWVHLATIGKDGSPHAAPMMMGIHGDWLTFSLTGKQKQRNLERDPRCCVSISRPGDFSFVVIWGTMQQRHDDEAQQIWSELIRNGLGEQGLQTFKGGLSPETRSLGLLTPSRWRYAGPNGIATSGHM